MPTTQGDGVSGERLDMIAWLEQRRDNCEAIAARPDTGAAEAARIMRRQLDVIIDTVRSGLHEGSAAVRAHLLAGRAQDEALAHVAATESLEGASHAL